MRNINHLESEYSQELKENYLCMDNYLLCVSPII